MTALGPIVFSLFERHKADKGMSPASIKSYRDAVKLFLAFVVSERRRMITSLSAEDLTAERVREFLSHLEIKRGNHIRTRNQRLAGLHAFFNYLAGQAPEMLAEAQKVAAIPRKKSLAPGTPYLERDELEALFADRLLGALVIGADQRYQVRSAGPQAEGALRRCERQLSTIRATRLIRGRLSLCLFRRAGTRSL